MTKSEYEVLLQKFIKSNQKARLRKAVSLGYSSSEAYMTYLKQKIEQGGDPMESTTKKSKRRVSKKSGKGSDVSSKKTIHHVYIVDRSGSMDYPRGKMQAAILGVNTDINNLKANTDTNHIVTLIDFDDYVTVYHEAEDINNVKEFYTSARSRTALYQTVGQAIEKALLVAGVNNTLVKIFTDGGENASRGKYQRAEVLYSLIEKVQNENNFTVTFIGTEDDTRNVVNRIGIDVTNTITHQNTVETVTATFDAMNVSTQTYSASVSRGENVSKGFYKKA